METIERPVISEDRGTISEFNKEICPDGQYTDSFNMYIYFSLKTTPLCVTKGIEMETILSHHTRRTLKSMAICFLFSCLKNHKGLPRQFHLPTGRTLSQYLVTHPLRINRCLALPSKDDVSVSHPQAMKNSSSNKTSSCILCCHSSSFPGSLSFHHSRHCTQMWTESMGL